MFNLSSTSPDVLINKLTDLTEHQVLKRMSTEQPPKRFPTSEEQHGVRRCLTIDKKVVRR